MADASANYGIEVGEKSVSGFVAYIAQFDPQFPERIQGASDEEINALEVTVRRPLPDEYKDFLRHLGQGYDRLVFGGECSVKVSSVSNFYQAVNEDLDAGLLEGLSDEETYFPPEGCLAIGTFCLSSDEVCLDLRKEGIAPVVGMDDGKTVFFSASLLHLLYCQGFIAYRLPTLSRLKFFTSIRRPMPREDFERAVTWASAAPWSPQWFSDRTSICVEGMGVAFCLTFFEQIGYTLLIGATTGSNLDETVQAISQIIGVPLKDTPLDPV